MDAAQIAGAQINRDRDSIAGETLARITSVQWEQYHRHGVSRKILGKLVAQDLSKLFFAVISHRPELFTQYLRWQRATYSGAQIPATLLKEHLTLLSAILAERLEDSLFAAVLPPLTEAGRALDELLQAPHSPTEEDDLPTTVSAHYLEAVRQGREEQATAVIQTAVTAGMAVQDIYLQVIQPVQREIGRLWQENEISVGEEHAATEISRLAMTELRRQVVPAPARGFRILTACLDGERHDLGARMVSDFFHFAGYEALFTGADTPHRTIVQELFRQDIDLLAISGTLTIQARIAINLIDAVRRDHPIPLPIMVGGYAFNNYPTLWQDVGADGFATDAVHAVVEAERLLALT